MSEHSLPVRNLWVWHDAVLLIDDNAVEMYIVLNLLRPQENMKNGINRKLKHEQIRKVSKGKNYGWRISNKGLLLSALNGNKGPAPTFENVQYWECHIYGLWLRYCNSFKSLGPLTRRFTMSNRLKKLNLCKQCQLFWYVCCICISVFQRYHQISILSLFFFFLQSVRFFFFFFSLSHVLV